MLVRFTPEADNELAEARHWYAHQRKDLDLEFMQSSDDALSRIVANPQQYPTVFRTLKRCVVRRFPFAIFYTISADEVEVVAIFHSRRNPRRWKSRKRKLNQVGTPSCSEVDHPCKLRLDPVAIAPGSDTVTGSINLSDSLTSNQLPVFPIVRGRLIPRSALFREPTTPFD
jgi:plasmid stabilization system protein ParE